MLPQLPFHGRELAALVRDLAPRLVPAAAVLVAVATVIAFCVVFAQLLTAAAPRIA